MKVKDWMEFETFFQYNLDKSESVEEPVEESEEEEKEEDEEEEEESDSLRKDDTEDEDNLDEIARKKEKNLNVKQLLLLGKMAIILSSIITGLFSAYLLFSYVQLRMKAAVSNMR